MKIVVLDGHALNPGDLSWKCFEEFGDITVYERTPDKEVASHIGSAEIVLLNKAPITAEVLEQCPNIRLICVLATGYNVVDFQAAREKGIPVCNVPDYSTASVAQFTFALLLELCHQVGHHNAAVHSGKWCACPDFCFWDTPQIELAGKTLGIIGFGRIGQRVGRIARAMDMRVLAYSRSQRPEGREIGEYVALDSLLSRSDIVSLHCPLTQETNGIISRRALDAMKDGAILLNTARGPLVDEQAISEALSSGKLLGYAADVVSSEPISSASPLLAAPNCILTPHMAWSPLESRQRVLECTVRSIRGFLKGAIVNSVNGF